MKSLTSVRGGKIAAPAKIVLYGAEGTGKSTAGAMGPRPIFLGAERGTEHLDVHRIPHEELTTFADAMEWLRILAREDHGYQTLVVDTVDWLEEMLHQEVAASYRVESIAQIKFAEGYKHCLPSWKRLLKALDYLRDSRGMHVLVLAHAKVTKHDDPAGESWDRWSLKLHDGKSASAADLVKEWSNEVLFVRRDERARGKNKWDRKSTGDSHRVVCSQRTPAWDAKTRKGLPEEIHLHRVEDWRKVWAPFLEAPRRDAKPEKKPRPEPTREVRPEPTREVRPEPTPAQASAQSLDFPEA